MDFEKEIAVVKTAAVKEMTDFGFVAIAALRLLPLVLMFGLSRLQMVTVGEEKQSRAALSPLFIVESVPPSAVMAWRMEAKI